MAGEEPQKVGLTDAEIEALADRLCEKLLVEPRLGHLVAALAEHVASRVAQPPAPLAPAPGPDGPAPIGPYDVAPEFSKLKWDGELRPADEWPRPVGESNEVSAGGVPPGPVGPQVSPRRHRMRRTGQG